jgi:hypothetical protein
MLVPPSGTPKPRLGATAVPERFTVCGVPNATTQSTPVRLPKGVGEERKGELVPLSEPERKRVSEDHPTRDMFLRNEANTGS